ncbi:hypothetical protein [Pseudomonas protegens]|nr:hypothetical protein [Pseudomonas protegens]
MWGIYLLLSLVAVMALFLCLRRRQPRGTGQRHRASACLGGEESYLGD